MSRLIAVMIAAQPRKLTQKEWNSTTRKFQMLPKILNILQSHEYVPMPIEIHNIHMHQWGLRFIIFKKFLRNFIENYNNVFPLLRWNRNLPVIYS